MADIWVNILGDASKLKGALDGASGHVSSFSEKIGKIGKIATVGGLAITAAFTKTFLNFTAYETKLIDMAKVTSEPFDQIEAKLGTINPVLGTSTELMGGYYQVISAGVKDPIKALDTLTISAKAGKAAHVAQSEVVKGITKMMAGYEGAIRGASEAADLLFAIEKEGQTTVAELIPYVGGLAKISFDLNIKQIAMAASMAVISKTAGSTAEAATQYKAVLTGLMKPTEDMTNAIEAMGYKTAEAAIEEEGFVAVLKFLKQYSEETGVSLARLFGRKEAMMAFSALGAEGFKVLDDTIISVGESAGGAEKAFLNWSESGAAAIDKIKSTFANFAVSIGEKVAPMIKNVLGTVTDIITKIMEWADENEELTEKIFTWGLALGAALVVLGPIAVILPGLVTGFTLLAPAMLPLAAGGVIVLGIKKLSEYLRETVGGMREFRAELELMELDAIDAELRSLGESAEQLQVKFYEIPEGLFGRSRRLTQEGQMISTMMDEINERMYLLYQRREELTKTQEAGIVVTKEGIDVAEEKLEVDKLIAEGQETVNRLLEEWSEKVKLYTKYTDTATESGAEFLDGMYRWTQVAKEWGQVSLYFMGVRDSLKAVEKATDEVTVAEETMAKATGKVYNKWYELAKLWAVRPDLRTYFLDSTRALEEVEEELRDEVSKWEEIFDNFKSSIESSLSSAFYNILSGTKTFGEGMKDLWKGIVDAILMQIAKVAASWVIKLVFGIPFEVGGGVSYDSGGKVKEYQAGGGVDTIPARLTVGEYVISKSMTDFIKRFKMFPSNLIDAIAGGFPTPIPAFATGGPVGTPNIAASGFGETKIIIDIHDNKIASDIDVKRLAVTISDEVLRKIEMKRRY